MPEWKQTNQQTFCSRKSLSSSRSHLEEQEKEGEENGKGQPATAAVSLFLGGGRDHLAFSKWTPTTLFNIHAGSCGLSLRPFPPSYPRGHTRKKKDKKLGAGLAGFSSRRGKQEILGGVRFHLPITRTQQQNSFFSPPLNVPLKWGRMESTLGKWPMFPKVNNASFCITMRNRQLQRVFKVK